MSLRGLPPSFWRVSVDLVHFLLRSTIWISLNIIIARVQKTLPRHQVPGKFMIRWWSNFWLMFQFWNTKFVRFQIYRPKLIPFLIQDLSWQSGIGHQIALYLLSIKISRSMLRWVLSGALSDPKNLLLTLSVTALAKKWRQKYLWGHN